MHRCSRLPALLLAAAAAACLAAAAAGARPQPAPIQAFSLADVELASSSEFGANFDQNAEYLLALSPDNLLYNFRTTAGLDAPGESYGGWEWSDSEVRGQFIGHYLSATAFAALHTGRQDMRDRCKLMVRGLKEVQDAYGNGYLAAFPEEHFDRLEALQPVWVPYYVVHKLLQGLLDQYSLAGQEQALGMAEGMAAYFCGRVAHVLEVNGTDHWHKILETEFGGMNDALYNLYAITQNESHAECAHWFDKPAFMRPLVEGQDPLPGLHANTHMAQVQGFAARYEQVGDPEGLAATAQFFGLLLQHHSFSTGGSNWYEHWAAEDSLGEAVNSTDAAFLTEESCTQYNVLKLARWLFRHTGDAALADFYERAMLNGVIGVQKLRRSSHHHSHSHSHSHPYLHLPGHSRSHSHSHPHSDHPEAIQQHTMSSGEHGEHGRSGGGSGGSDASTHDRTTHRNDSHPHYEYAPRRVTRIHVHNSHFHNSTATIHIHVHGGQGDVQPTTAAATEGTEGAGDAVVLHAEQRRRLAQASSVAAAAAAASGGQGLARPENYKVMSWPGEPWSAARAAAAASAALNDEYPPEAGPGVFIYFQPMGAGGWKGDKSHSWSHGWGDAFNTFWCCYGTAVESFSKLADSIYFKHMPDVRPSAAHKGSTNLSSDNASRASSTSTGAASNAVEGGAAAAAAGSDASGAAAGAGAGATDAQHASASPLASQTDSAAASLGDGPLPELWVNQLVSSSVRWRELRLVARQEAELYGPNSTATSRLTIDIYPPDASFPEGAGWGASRGTHSGKHSVPSSGGGSGAAAPGVAGEESRRFALNWRIPGWAKASEVQLRVNGRDVTHCTDKAAAAANGGKAPPFGEGARFCTLGYSWSHGDEVEAVLPMRVRAESLNDARKPLHRLKAIMLGPLLMAGLTNGTNDVSLDPKQLEEALSLPDEDGLVSLAAAGTAGTASTADASTAGPQHAPPLPPPLLRLCGGNLQLGRGCSGGSAGAAPLEATFRLVAPLAGCEAGEAGYAGSPAGQTEESETAAGTAGCSPARTRQLLMQPQPADSLGGTAADGDAWSAEGHRLASFESAAWPGHLLTADPHSGTLLLQQASQAPAGHRSQTFLLRPAQHSATTAGRSGGQLAFTLEPLSQPGSAVVADGLGSLRLQTASEAFLAGATPFLLAPPAAPAYPPGARLLRGGTRDYLLVPIGQIQDELYTAYFSFLPPSQQ